MLLRKDNEVNESRETTPLRRKGGKGEVNVVARPGSVEEWEWGS